MGSESDEDLMLAYAGGNEEAFRTLFARYAPMLIRVLERRVGRAADAQDLAQQTFLQLHRARRDFRAGMRLRPWLITIALNLSRDLLRRRNRRPEDELEEHTLGVEPVAVRALDEADVASRVRAALVQLPSSQREVIELHWFDGLSFAEIAQVCGCTAGAVRVRAHRGYVALRETLCAGNVPIASDVRG
jgi:RNA polymerase sigma-70 factor (ECF subfamily)